MKISQIQDGIDKLQREIWLFEQWLQGADQVSLAPVEGVQDKIRQAYRESIISRKLELAKFESMLQASDCV